MSGSAHELDLDSLNEIVVQAKRDIAQISDVSELDDMRVKLLGRKGTIKQLLNGIGALPEEQRPQAGKNIHVAKTEIESRIASQRELLNSRNFKQDLMASNVDVTLPGRTNPRGGPHPLTRTLTRIQEIFSAIGFEIAIGPEIEDDYHNFEALNIPPEHPARAMQDTFYFEDDLLLRTHTSPVQIRYMQNNAPPIRIIAPGRVYRCDSDVTHSPMFHQVEGLVVDETTTFADLKGILQYFIQEYFEMKLELRFRPSYFPFTEPSAEVDINCVFCDGSGCKVCKRTGWLEVLGCGMVHPALYGHVGIDAEKYTGYAFGLGVERFTMLRYGVNDLRTFFENDLEMLRQFRR